MKTFLIRTLCVVVLLATLGAAQDVIPLPTSAGPNSTPENYPEKEYFSKIWSTDVVTNVTKPSLTVFKPSLGLRNGTALVICPGGSFMALDINSEGNDVAKYVAARGVTAFVLKYRLAHTGERPTGGHARQIPPLEQRDRCPRPGELVRGGRPANPAADNDDIA